MTFIYNYYNAAHFQSATLRKHMNLWKTISSHITLSSCQLQRMTPFNETDSTCLRDGAHIYHLPGLDIVTWVPALLGPGRAYEYEISYVLMEGMDRATHGRWKNAKYF